MPQTLLLADDSVTIQRVIELTFADEDIKVLAVSDGDQAIGQIDANPPDIVLVDVGMPGRSGYEVARHIKKTERLSHIPVLLLTGAFEPVDQAKAVEAGCDGVLAKPFEPQLVIARVKELLARGAAGAAAAPAAAPAVEDWAPKAPEWTIETNAVKDPAPPEAPPVWTEPPAPAAPPVPAGDAGDASDAGASGRPPLVASLDNYFAQLDEAFATLETAPAARAAMEVPEPEPSLGAVDWLAATPGEPAAPADAAAPAEPDLSFSSFLVEETPTAASDPGSMFSDPSPAASEPEAASVWGAPAAPAATAAVPEPEPVAAFASFSSEPASVSSPLPAAAAGLPSLGDAFAAILASEEHEPMPAVAPSWPASAPASSNGLGAGLTDEAVEDIARSVLERLTERVVRETVADLVSGIAERLVREEIERIKASIH